MEIQIQPLRRKHIVGPGLGFNMQVAEFEQIPGLLGGGHPNRMAFL